MGFLDCRKEDADGLSLVESESSVVCSTDQMVRQCCLNDSERTSHVLALCKVIAKTNPVLYQICSDTKKLTPKKHNTKNTWKFES